MHGVVQQYRSERLTPARLHLYAFESILSHKHLMKPPWAARVQEAPKQASTQHRNRVAQFSWHQPIDAPAIAVTHIDEAIVQPRSPALPELPLTRHHPVAAPIGIPRHLAFRVTHGHLGK